MNVVQTNSNIVKNCYFKVVYALNSKNDESENLISSLKCQFEEEKEQLFLETNKKLEEFKVQIYSKTDNSRTISELESKLRDFQQQKTRAIDDFEAFKLRTIESESRQSQLHRDELIQMTKLVEQLRVDQKQQAKKFEAISSQLQESKEQALDEMKCRHQKELDGMKNSLMSRTKSDVDTIVSKLKAEHEREIGQLQTDLASLLEKFNEENSQNEGNIETLKMGHGKEVTRLEGEVERLKTKLASDATEHDQAIQKLKLFHEKELEARSQNSNSEYLSLIENLKGQMAGLSKEKAFMEADLNKR